MLTVYKNAAMLVVHTLGLHGAVIADISTFAPPKSAPSSVFGPEDITAQHKTPTQSRASLRFEASDESRDTPKIPSLEFSDIPTLSILASSAAPADDQVVDEGLSTVAQLELRSFLTNHPDGQIYEGAVPSCFHRLVPENKDYAMSMFYPSLGHCLIRSHRILQLFPFSMWTGNHFFCSAVIHSIGPSTT